MANGNNNMFKNAQKNGTDTQRTIATKPAQWADAVKRAKPTTTLEYPETTRSKKYELVIKWGI